MKGKFSFFWLILFLGCSDLAQKVRSVNIDNQAIIMVPLFMDTTSNLHKYADLQVQNPKKEVYAMVITAGKDSFKSNYQDFGFYSDSLSVLKNYAQLILATMEDQGLKATDLKEWSNDTLLFYALSGNRPDIAFPLSYIVAFKKGKSTLYSFTAWTYQSRIKKYKPIFIKMAQSIKE